jgi:hypothetical protein
LEYFKDIWEILLPFGTFFVDLVHFSGFGTTYKHKSGNPDPMLTFFILKEPCPFDRYQITVILIT